MLLTAEISNWRTRLLNNNITIALCMRRLVFINSKTCLYVLYVYVCMYYMYMFVCIICICLYVLYVYVCMYYMFFLVVLLVLLLTFRPSPPFSNPS